LFSPFYRRTKRSNLQKSIGKHRYLSTTAMGMRLQSDTSLTDRKKTRRIGDSAKAAAVSQQTNLSLKFGVIWRNLACLDRRLPVA
jgi:hypothetical protein